MQTCITILLWALFVTPVMAEEFSWPHGKEGTSGGGGTHGQDEFSFQTDASYPRDIVNPDAAMQARLLV